MHRSDDAAVQILKSILDSEKPAALKLKDVAMELSKCSTTNSILMSHGQTSVAPRKQEPNYVVSAGVPAELLTVRESIEKTKAELEESARKNEKCERCSLDCVRPSIRR